MILVQGFCPLKIEITQFSDGFRVEPLTGVYVFLDCAM